MGCVQSKRASRDEPSAAGQSERQRELEELSNALRSVVKDRKDGMEVARGTEREQVKRAGDSPVKERQRPRPEPYLRGQRGWPSWLLDALGDAIQDWTPRCANTFEKLDKIGQGTYSNVYKARDLITGKIVALKKVRFDNLGPESVKFMGREILVLRNLNHPNVIKLEGLVTSRMSCSLYLVFEYMEHDLAGLVGQGSYLSTNQGRKFTEPQVKCYMKQLLAGLEHCHNHGVLHRDIKGSNLLINNEGILKIADFGLATFFDPDQRQPMTSRVVTLWYRPPELLLGATYYGVGVDLWSVGCILAELLAGKPIMPGRTEVEQVHKIFKLCGSPSEEYWKKSKLPHATIFKPQQPYKRCVVETFKDFPCSSLPLIETLLSIDPDERGTATSALNSEFFTTEPYACEPSSLPKCPPTKEIDVIKLRDEARRQRGASGKANVVDGNRRARARDRGGRAVPAPEANAELLANLDKWRVVNPANSESKSEKFPPPHQDGAVGFPHTSRNGPVSFGAADTTFSSSFFNLRPPASIRNGTAGGPSKRKSSRTEPQTATATAPAPAPSRRFLRLIKASSTTLSMHPNSKGKESVSEVFGSQKVK